MCSQLAGLCGRLTTVLSLWGGATPSRAACWRTSGAWLYRCAAGCRSRDWRTWLHRQWPWRRPSLGWGWVHGANYGLVMSSPFSMWLPDLYGFYGPRFPTQMLACAPEHSLVLALHRLSRLHPPRAGWPCSICWAMVSGIFCWNSRARMTPPYWGLVCGGRSCRSGRGRSGDRRVVVPGDTGEARSQWR